MLSSGVIVAATILHEPRITLFDREKKRYAVDKKDTAGFAKVEDALYKRSESDKSFVLLSE